MEFEPNADLLPVAEFEAPKKMFPVIKQKWLEALRSGEYRQGPHYLRTKPDGPFGERFCCLGVLCNLYAQETGTAWENRENLSYYKFNAKSGYLPPAVADWSGLDESIGKHVKLKVKHGNETLKLSLMAMNDGYRMSFEEIAKLIEEQL